MGSSKYDLVDERRHYSQQFYLIPHRLNQLQVPIQLEWQMVKFTKENTPWMFTFCIEANR